jgi:D-3-phosphoglycerate dehydrogenase
MDLLIIEPLEAEVMTWLESRYSVRYSPELANDPRGFRQALYNVRALVLPPAVALDAQALHYAPVLRAVGRVSAGSENIDLDACVRAGVEVVRSLTATAAAEAEFMIGALLSLLRRVPVVGSDGMLVGRELGAVTVGLVGMAPAARSMAHLLGAFGSRVVGYDPAVHTSDGMWERLGVQPRGLRELLEESDAVCVQLAYYTRYHGLLGDRFLPYCKPDQVMVSIAHSALFDEQALADVLSSGRMAAAWMDSMEPGARDFGRPLHDIDSLQVTPRVASTTRESRLRSSWAVVKRIDELLRLSPMAMRDFRPTGPGVQTDLVTWPAST